jgi:hypothetical protein
MSSLSICQLETSCHPSRYFGECKNDFVWPFDTLKRRFIDFTEVVFNTSLRQIKSTQDHSTT